MGFDQIESGRLYDNGEGISFSFYDSNMMLPDDFVAGWKKTVSECNNVNSIYQSPEWFCHLASTRSDIQLFLCVVRMESRGIIGIVPVYIGSHKLKYDISARSIYSRSLKALYILGSHPLLYQDEHIYSRLIDKLWEEFPGCDLIYIDSLTTDSFFWQYLTGTVRTKGKYKIYIPDGIRAFHSINLQGSFEKYFSKFSSKKRYNLKSQVRNLNEQGKGRLRLIRIECKDDIGFFLESAASISRRSWQGKTIGKRIGIDHTDQKRFNDLADRGLLRSYLLICDNSPCSFVYGLQYQDVYHYVEIAYDPAYARYSPGAVLLFMLLEDLFSYNAPRILNFGIGDAFYKQKFGNVHSEDASVMIFRNTPLNRILYTSHALFKSSITFAKKVINNS